LDFNGYAQDEGFFEEQGLRVEFMKMSEEAAIPALVRGDLDVWGGLLSANFLNAMSRGAKIKIVAEKGHFSSTGCVSGAMLARKALVESGEMHSPYLLEKNPEVGKRFMTAYPKGVRQSNQGKTPRNLEILTKNTRMDRELLQDVCWRKWRNDGRIDTKGLLEFQDWAIEKGLLDRKIPVDRFWDPRYVEHANKVIGAPPK
jgi:ABC-type nitrate/sulfonate/bicarbonate transport system substrate-binding protein